MSSRDYIQVALYFLLLALFTPMLGQFMYRIYTGKPWRGVRFIEPAERLIARIISINRVEETDWKRYTFDLLVFNVLGFLVLFLLQVWQSWLPLNPARLPSVSWDSAVNTAVSFVTNTNWQGYAGETTLSYLVQMAGLTVQNFVSAATGIAVLFALMRGLTGINGGRIGNFRADLSRITLYILLPLSLLLAILLAGEGVIQTFSPPVRADTLNGGSQLIPLGPVASQVAIKQLGTNGGGYFNANSAHPFENPTPFSNFLQMFAILLIPAALTYTYGKAVGSVKHGWIIFTVMAALLLIGMSVSLYSEYTTHPAFGQEALMEGKETRFGITGSAVWSAVTTAASNGSVNTMHDSLSPLSGMVAMIFMMLGEIIFGGVGSGLYGMVVFIILTVFIAGLMVGRTPEYLGRKIEAFEVKMAMLAVLIPCLVILIFSAIAVLSAPGLQGLNNRGPHGLSEIVYAFSSAAGNNGSAFAGLSANTPFYNITLAIAMIAGRYGVIIPVLAIAGSLAKKIKTPDSSGTFRTDNGIFMVLLTAVILIVGGLTFFPVLTLGPLVEHLLLLQGITF
jgi:K+-transporting ATPase ATPase A chain